MTDKTPSAAPARTTLDVLVRAAQTLAHASEQSSGLYSPAYRAVSQAVSDEIARLRATPAPAPRTSCEYCDGTGDVHRPDGEWHGECTACPAAAMHAFKNFHRLLCERFGYGHDEKDWRRDQLSLIEFIASKAQAPVAGELSPSIRTLLSRCADFIDATTEPGYPAGADLADEIEAILKAPQATHQPALQVAPQQCTECLEQARLLGMGAEREAALQAQVEQLTRAGGTAPEMADVPRRREELDELTDEQIAEIYGAWSDAPGTSYADLIRSAIAFDRELRAPGMTHASAWQPIETAPTEGREMFVVKGFNVTAESIGARNYTTDPYCVWPRDGGGLERWPHPFPPTHWMPLPAAPDSSVQVTQGEKP